MVFKNDTTPIKDAPICFLLYQSIYAEGYIVLIFLFACGRYLVTFPHISGINVKVSS